MKSDRKPTLSRLREADPRKYAELCEKARCYKEAYHFYSQCSDPEDLLHAARIALVSNRKDNIRGLCKKAIEITPEENQGQTIYLASEILKQI